ncbi:MAG: NAD(P)H-binding protein [Gemmatimonadaceae bacterium]|nr:NAD(P)H-binding protein [Gemmatimonadaceae bacterium]NUQ93472.1 NAD(P)H-binding protein [Gemmatimonadaceae bacterium]NUR19246.1 NAD(P)H-binding protein [Gemmatimonadaceae bacterium]
MKIVLFGATGNVGQRIAKEALSRGHDVVGVVRDPDKVTSPDPRVKLVAGDATDAGSVERIAREAKADALVSAISPRPNARGRAAPSLAAASRALLEGAQRSGVKRVIAVGGAGSLEVAPGKLLMNAPGFPDAYKAEAQEGYDSLEVFRKEGKGVDWTLVSPAAEIGPGQRTGKFRQTIDTFLADSAGHSRISFEDFAVAIVDELEKGEHLGRRFGVAY